MRMQKKSVVITGSANGLGKALALEFSKNGYNIILSDIDKKNLEKVKKEIIKNKVKCISVAGDLTKKETLEKIQKILRKEEVNILVNNVGLHCPHLVLEKISDNEIENIIKVNLLSPIFLTKRVYKKFIKQKSGTIININSISGLKNHKLRSIYSASKWGLRGFSESFKIEAEENNVRIIDIYPGRIKTRPEFKFGMNPDNVAQKIYYEFKYTRHNKITIDGKEYD